MKPRPNKPLPRFVFVYLDDPASAIGWEDAVGDEFKHEDTFCRMAGFIVKEDKTHITLAQLTGVMTPEHANRITLPKKCILWIKDHKFPRPPRDILKARRGV